MYNDHLLPIFCADDTVGCRCLENEHKKTNYGKLFYITMKALLVYLHLQAPQRWQGVEH